jgi:hypothetical protein
VGGLLLALTLLVVSVASADDVAVRVRDNGRVDVRVTSAPLALVLDRLASQTGINLTYEGSPPERLVTLEVYGASQALAVLDILERLGLDYAVTTNPAGTRILSLVVADAARVVEDHPDLAMAKPAPPPNADSMQPGGEPVRDHEPESGAEPQVASEPEPGAEPQAAGELDPGGAPGPRQNMTPLPDDFVPGVRATGQASAEGMPLFVLPDPPDLDAPVDWSAYGVPPERKR